MDDLGRSVEIERTNLIRVLLIKTNRIAQTPESVDSPAPIVRVISRPHSDF